MFKITIIFCLCLAGLYYLLITSAFLLGFFYGEERANRIIDGFVNTIFFWLPEDGTEVEER